MELNNSISTLYKLSAFGHAHQPKESLAVGQSNARSGFQRASLRGQRSNADHIAQLSQRIEKMASMLTRLKQATPALNEAPTVSVESPRENDASFTYSVTQDENGNVTESYTFKVQYKPAGESGFIEVGATALSAPDDVVKAQPSADQAIDPVAAVTEDGGVAADPLTFEEHIAKLIEYYRIATAGVSDEDDARVDGDETPHVGGHDDHDDGVRNVNLINIDADYVSRIYSGGADDVFAINADTVRRIGAQGGDDTLTINADHVARIRTGAGDDTVNIEADNVRRISTGAGDDALNIIADHVARINTGEGDDTLNITANTVTRINTGEGDDVLNLTADTIKRVNVGAGDDTITIDANDAAIAFGKGGGEDVINITSVGALAIQIDSALAASSDDINIVTEGAAVRLEFASGESLTINNVDNADMISVRVGGEDIHLHLSDAPQELDVSA